MFNKPYFNNNYAPGYGQNNNLDNMQSNFSSCNQNKNLGCTTYMTLNPIYSCSKNIVNTYHVSKQPYVHNYHTEVVHHHITENEYVPTYSCSEVHVNDNPIYRN